MGTFLFAVVFLIRGIFSAIKKKAFSGNRITLFVIFVTKSITFLEKCQKQFSVFPFQLNYVLDSGSSF